jgi:hypothetical protein
MASGSSLPAYVERDGDWVWRPPGVLQHVTMHLFVLRADRATLEVLCRSFVDEPTSGTFRARPLFPGFVLLVCADIGHGYSADPVDCTKGWMTERDVGFFVPVDLAGPRGAGVVNLLPYLFVDNFAAVVIGREIFGFPKVLGRMSFSNAPLRFTVNGQALARFDPTHQVDGDALLVDVRQRGKGSEDDLVAALAADLGRQPDVGELVAEASRRVLALLDASATTLAGPTIPMVFLKQFRDVAVRNRACHSSLVRADARIDALRSLRILTDGFEVELPPYDSLGIVRHLGLSANAAGIVEPLVTLRAELDFTLPYGRNLFP